MSHATPTVRALYDQEMEAARAPGDPDLRWAHLERAHIGR